LLVEKANFYSKIEKLEKNNYALREGLEDNERVRQLDKLV